MPKADTTPAKVGEGSEKRWTALLVGLVLALLGYAAARTLVFGESA